MSDVHARVAREDDIDEIRDIFMDAYGEDYPYQYFYDEIWLKRAVFGDHLEMVVAEDTETGEVLGTGSVVFDVGAHSDLIGEFGRLAVHSKARGRGIAKLIKKYRIELIEDRLHVAIVDNRTSHPISQKISHEFGFAAVGLMPLKHRFDTREHIAVFARHFGPALNLRRNNPRIVPEAAALAHQAMINLQMDPDTIIDESTPPYHHDRDFIISELESEAMPHLLRIERGRVKQREVFGPMRLHYGFFMLSTNEANYLVARRPASTDRPVAGALGYLYDEYERNIRVFELIAASDAAIRHLLVELLNTARDIGAEYIEIEVSAHGTRMQRTLIELGFLPTAYIPAMVFHEVERLDVIKMVRLLVEPTRANAQLIEPMKPLFNLVMDSFETQAVLPRIEESMEELSIFEGLTDEQARRVAGVMSLAQYETGELLFEADGPADEFFVLIEGEVHVSLAEGTEVGTIGCGDVVGENSMLSETAHTVHARATEPTTTAVLSRDKLDELTRQRPDIGMRIYRNLAVSLGAKLRRMDMDMHSD